MIQISKKQVDKAGDVLRASSSDSDALSSLSIWRAEHIYPLSLAYKLVKRYTDKLGNHALYGQRMKRISSILHKLRRNPSMKMSRMQDIGGCRVILGSYKQLFDLSDALKKSRSILPNEKNYISYPKEDGYRSVHLIYTCTSGEYDGFKIEIQLRTEIQHAWATTVEIVDAFANQNLKLGGGSDDWKELFILVSDEFALLEGLPVLSREPNIDRLRCLTDKLQVLQKLNEYSHTLGLVNDQKSSKFEYCLLLLNLSSKIKKFIGYSNKQEAVEAYLELETEYLTNSNINIVLLKMSDLKQIKKSYPNYFADSKKFIATLQKIINV